MIWTTETINCNYPIHLENKRIINGDELGFKDEENKKRIFDFANKPYSNLLKYFACHYMCNNTLEITKWKFIRLGMANAFNLLDDMKVKNEEDIVNYGYNNMLNNPYFPKNNFHSSYVTQLYSFCYCLVQKKYPDRIHRIFLKDCTSYNDYHNVTCIDVTRNIRAKYEKEIYDFLIFLKESGKSANTLKKYFTALGHFTEYLHSYQNEIELKDIDNKIISMYVDYIKNKFQVKTQDENFGYVNVFLNYLSYSNKIESAICILNDERPKRQSKIEPKPLSSKQEELIVEMFPRLSEIEQDILYVGLRSGFRPNELAKLEINCFHTAKERTVSYYMYKTNKNNEMMIGENAELIIRKNIELSKKKFGSKAKYVFQVNDGMSNKKPYVDLELLVNKVNRMFEKEKIMDENGEVMHFASKQFRSTYATKLLTRGVDPRIIAKMLGHSNLDSLCHYAEVHTDLVRDSMVSPFRFFNQIILKARNEEPIIDNSIVTISGKCNHSNNVNCKNAYQCYNCPKYIPLSTSHSLRILDNELVDAKNDLEMYRRNNNKEFVDYYLKLIPILENKRAKLLIQCEKENVS